MSTIRTNAILDASGGNTATINGITPISAADAGGTTLLGTLNTTSGTTQTLSGLDLTPYKFIQISFVGVSHSSGTSNGLQLGGFGTLTPSSTVGSSTEISGQIFSETASGVGWYHVSIASLFYRAVDLPLISSTTSISFSWTAGATFDAGTIRVYGVK